MKKTVRRCPICSHKFGDVIGNIKSLIPDGATIPASYDIVVCEKCGFTFADTAALQGDYNNYYKEYNIYSSLSVRKNRLDILNQLRVNFISKYIHKDARIIDIGCGQGSLLAALKEKGYVNLMGMDPSEESIDQLKKRGIRGIQGNIFDEIQNKNDGLYDLVISTAVMEHIRDIEGYFENLKTYLAVKGCIFIDVPAADMFNKTKTHLADNFNFEHINFFGKKSLDNLFCKHGFIRKNEDCLFPIAEKTQDNYIYEMLYCQNGEQKKISRDDISGKAIKQYLNSYNYDTYLLKIDEFVNSDSLQLAIWGAGSLSFQLLAISELLRKKVKFIIDNNKSKQSFTVDGIRIISPEEFEKCHSNDCKILICTMHGNESISNQIEKMNKKIKYADIMK